MLFLEKRFQDPGQSKSCKFFKSGKSMIIWRNRTTAKNEAVSYTSHRKKNLLIFDDPIISQKKSGSQSSVQYGREGSFPWNADNHIPVTLCQCQRRDIQRGGNLSRCDSALKRIGEIIGRVTADKIYRNIWNRPFQGESQRDCIFFDFQLCNMNFLIHGKLLSVLWSD